ncbi:uncharacterized protein B0H64DRAFT_28691 [Chaetomium fimeti]|uniref:Uncharacterized protein n=1 Tax=Chaetomium fimeti TaxID=1854472 RepID=A0AAE0LXB1_9PEZI|nr:hypothetical protein B0H64DRAFT_28691 [Chaetomium fimeti]
MTSRLTSYMHIVTRRADNLWRGTEIRLSPKWRCDRLRHSEHIYFVFFLLAIPSVVRPTWRVDVVTATCLTFPLLDSNSGRVEAVRRVSVHHTRLDAVMVIHGSESRPEAPYEEAGACASYTYVSFVQRRRTSPRSSGNSAVGHEAGLDGVLSSTRVKRKKV